MPALEIEEGPSGPACSADDYWSLPEGRRAELIGGRLYDMVPPSREHQKIALKLSRALDELAEKTGCPCEVYPAPCAVNVKGDGSSWVEPDVSVVCDPSKLSDRGCEGAPDLVVEVVSPSSRGRDYLTKAALYSEAHARECWIVDPAISQTAVYRYELGEVLPTTYPFSSPIPIGIAEAETTGGSEAPGIAVADLLA